MQSPERETKPLAIPEQAADLLKEVGTFTTLKGEHKGHASIYKLAVSNTPAEVTAHLPEVANGSASTDLLHVSQWFDKQTGQPKRSGKVATVTYIRDERIDPDHMFSTYVDYNINTADDGSTYNIDRTVTHVQVTPNTVRKASEAMAQYALSMAVDSETVVAQQAAAEAKIAEEQALGLRDVYQIEAQQVIDMLGELNHSS